MAHELERLANGQTAFASARLSAWHQLGTVTEACMSAEEIMAKAFLGGWAVRKIPVFGVDVIDGVEQRIDCDDKRMTVRRNVVTGETEYLGIVGEDYGVVQNEQCAEILDRLVDQVGGAHFETAGSLRKGKSVFVTMKLPEAMQVAGTDDLDLYLVATTSHDGTASLRVDATPVRVVCANTQRAAFAQTKGTYVFRHTPNVNSQITQAREAIGLMWKYMDRFQAAAERMLNAELTLAELESVVEKVWPLAQEATERARNNAKQRTATIRYLARDADTQADIRGTHWAGYQAIVEYIDHIQPAKDELARANRAVSTSAEQLKTKAFDLLTV
jgi:phage/plasmid-like protein (TIGR03299 family)